MYKVTIQTLTGSEHTIYYPASKDYTLTSAKLSLQVGSAGEFNFTVPFNNPYYSKIVRNSIVTVYEDGDELWRGDIREINTSFDKSLEVYALEDLAWLGDEAVAMTAITNQTYAQRFQNSISAYNSNQVTKRQFTAGYLTSVTSSNLCTWKPNWEMSLLDCLRDFVAGDGYLKVRRVTSGGSVTRYIDIVDLDDYGKNATQQIQFGYNLMEFVKDMDMTNFLNVLYPYGAETDTVLYDDVMQRITGTPIQNNTSIATYGRRARTVVFETENLTTLNNLASAYLTRYSQPRLTLKIKAVDLGGIDTTIEKFYLGDYVRVIAKPFGIDQQIYITKQELDLMVMENNSVEMSDTVHISSLTSQVIGITTEIERQPSSSSILQAAKQNAINILTGTDGGYLVFGFNASNQIESLAIMNAPTDDTATKKWMWTLGGLGYLHRDQASDPWSNLNVAMTSDGSIVADFITSGTLDASQATITNINASNINTGTLSANYINGGTLTLGGNQDANGVFSLKNSSNTEVVGMNNTGITATAGEIGGFTIDANSIRSGDLTSTSAGAVAMANTDFTRTVGGTSRADLRLAIGGNYAVDETGKVYATTQQLNNGDLEFQDTTNGNTAKIKIGQVISSVSTLNIDSSTNIDLRANSGNGGINLNGLVTTSKRLTAKELAMDTAYAGVNVCGATSSNLAIGYVNSGGTNYLALYNNGTTVGVVALT